MDLNTLWFILITVLFTGFFVLEGFDYGVGILLPVLGKDDTERRMIINTIGPFWDGNEVWLLTAGGAMFAAFPMWYATMFSGFYLALVLMLFALIMRGVAFEFRSKNKHPRWRAFWDWSIFFGSLVPALLWGVALGNLLQGVPIDADMNYVGDFFSLLSPFTLLTGVYTVVLATLHGAVFLSGKLGDELADRARKAAWRMWIVTVPLAIVTIIGLDLATDIIARARRGSGRHPPHRLDRFAGERLVHPQQARRLGVRLDGGRDCVRHRHGLHDAVSARDDLQPQSGVEPDDL